MSWLRRRWRELLAGLAVIIGLILFTTWPTDLLSLPLIVNQAPQPADVIIVLGAGTRRGAEPVPPQAQARILRGQQLLNQEYGPRLLMAGGFNKKTGLVESATMKAWAVRQGIPTEQILEEPRSRNTHENAVNSLAIMRAHGWKTANVVTSDYHTRRACAIFHKLGASVRCVAARYALVDRNTPYERLMNFRSVIREYGATVLFRVRGYL